MATLGYIHHLNGTDSLTLHAVCKIAKHVMRLAMLISEIYPYFNNTTLNVKINILTRGANFSKFTKRGTSMKFQLYSCLSQNHENRMISVKNNDRKPKLVSGVLRIINRLESSQLVQKKCCDVIGQSP